MILKALIFDVDGTLAESERDGHRVAFNLAFQQAGVEWRWDIDTYGELLAIGGGKERLRYYISRFQTNFNPHICLDQFISQLHQSKSAYYRQLLTENAIPLRPGIQRLISQARQQGLRIAIASTAALPNVTALLQTALGEEALSWFELIAAGDIVEQKKPAPDIYLYVLEKMGLKPGECLVIEDSYQGLTAATKAGLKTVITLNEYTQAQDFREAVLVLNHLGEPDLPFTILKGDAKNKPYFDVELAKLLV